MVSSAALRVSNDIHYRKVDSFEDLLGGNTYAFLSENVLLFEDKDGGYVVFTIDPKATYTVEDYMELPEGAPFELLNGKLTYMPSPKDFHQAVSLNLATALHVFVRKNKLGIIREAPFDVHLSKKNIFQPDILFLSNDRKERRKDWIYGAPDLVVEIISKGREKIDRKTKFKQYEKHGVLEYWLIDLAEKTVEVYEPETGKFVLREKLTTGGTLASSVVAGFEIPISEIFETEE